MSDANRQLADEIREEMRDETSKFIANEAEFRAHLSTPAGLVDCLLRASNAQKKVIRALSEELMKYVPQGIPAELMDVVGEYLSMDSIVSEAIKLNTGLDINELQEAPDA